MACACKTAKVLEKKFGSSNGKHGKKGFWYYIKFLLSEVILKRLLGAVVLAFICLIIMPFMLVFLIISQLINGQAHMFIPEKFARNIKEITEQKEDEQKLQTSN